MRLITRIETGFVKVCDKPQDIRTAIKTFRYIITIVLHSKNEKFTKLKSEDKCRVIIGA